MIFDFEEDVVIDLSNVKVANYLKRIEKNKHQRVEKLQKIRQQYKQRIKERSKHKRIKIILLDIYG